MNKPFFAPRGMALIAVLWLVAAMSIVITGVVKSVRLEARNAGLQRHAAIASAMADAAILLALQKLQAQPEAARLNQKSIPVSFAGQSIDVQMMQLNGLVDINNAPLILLADLYHYAGEIDPDSALTLAQATLDVRTAKNSKATATGFEAPEDLLRVPGFTYTLYAKINPLITADLKNGGGRINPQYAPYGVLLVLSAGDALRASALLNQRSANPAIIDTSFIKPELIEMASSSSLKLQTLLTLPDAATLQKEWTVAMVADARSGLPWRVLHTRQAALAASQPLR